MNKVSNSDVSFFQEIEEEVRNDKQMKFLKDNKNTIISVLAVIVVCIIAYSSWHERKIKNMEDITNSLLEIIQTPSDKNGAVLAKLIEDAPAELKPILTILKSGRELAVGEFADKNLQPLLDLSQRSGVDIVWKDLALMIYTSYPTKPYDELIELLKPLTANNRPFRLSALESMAMIYANESKYEDSVKCLDKILNDRLAPSTMKKRIKMLIEYIKAKAGITSEPSESAEAKVDDSADNANTSVAENVQTSAETSATAAGAANTDVKNAEKQSEQNPASAQNANTETTNAAA